MKSQKSSKSRKICEWFERSECRAIRRSLIISELWPAPKKSSDKIKFMIILLLTANGCSSIIGLIRSSSTEDRLLSMLYFFAYFQILVITIIYKLRSSLLVDLYEQDPLHCRNFFYFDKDQVIVNRYRAYLRYASIGFFSCSCAAAIGTVLTPIITKVITGQPLKLIWTFWYEPKSDDFIVLVVIYLAQFASTSVANIVISSSYSYLVLIVLKGCEQFEVLSNYIKNYKPCHHIRGCLVKERIGMRCRYLKRIIDGHVALINYVKLCNEFLSPIIILQFCTCTVGFCVCASEIIEKFHEGNVVHTIRAAIYGMVFIPPFYLIFWLGEKLIETSSKIGDTIYKIKWYKCTIDEIHSLMMIIAFSTTSVKITAGGYITMSLESFKNWLATAISYLSVLIAVKSQ